MALWYPSADVDELGNAGSYSGGPFKGVLHTTEAVRYSSARSAYVANKSNPHFTTTHERGYFQVYQHCPINVASLALKNIAGGAQTNKDSAIQIEISWRAAEIDKIATGHLIGLRSLMRWIEAQTGIRRISPTFKPYPASYGNNGVRLSGAAWDFFGGWCGHQHVPENDHGDPGAINIAYLLGNPLPTPQPEEDEEMKSHVVQATGDPTKARYLTNGQTRRWLQDEADLSFWLSRVEIKQVQMWPYDQVARIPVIGEPYHP